MAVAEGGELPPAVTWSGPIGSSSPVPTDHAAASEFGYLQASTLLFNHSFMRLHSHSLECASVCPGRYVCTGGKEEETDNMRHVDESRNYVRDRDVARRGQRHVRRTPRSVSRAPLWPINVSSETSSHFLHRNSFPRHHPHLARSTCARGTLQPILLRNLAASCTINPSPSSLASVRPIPALRPHNVLARFNPLPPPHPSRRTAHAHCNSHLLEEGLEFTR